MGNAFSTYATTEAYQCWECSLPFGTDKCQAEKKKKKKKTMKKWGEDSVSRSVIDITEICWKQVENAPPKGRRVRKRGENKTRHEKQMYINSKHGVER